MTAGVKPPSHLLTTLLHHAIHNPTMWKNLPLQLHRPDASAKGVVFPGERQRELQDISCASSAHTIKLFPCSLIHPTTHAAILFYFCPIFYYAFTHVTARKGTQHFCNTHRLWGPKNTQDCLAVLSKRSSCTMMLAVTQGSSHTPGSLAVFTVAFQQQHGEFPRSKAAHEASARSWGHLAQSCT